MALGECEMKTIYATIIARNETEFWDSETLKKYRIEAVFCLYLVPDDEETTVDVLALPLENVFHHEPGTPETLIDAARDELDREGLESVDYLMRDSVVNCDPRFMARDETEFDSDEIDIETAWREAESAGLAWPAILDRETFDAWQLEKQAARRALNVPPIANYGANGLDNLPLFVAAANRIIEQHKPALERLARIKGECAAMKAGKRKLYESGLTWKLPPAEMFRAAR
jgi:hypothetical protein